MKVAVRFGDTNVVVPVGDGRGVLVKDLIEAAIVRYKKATNKGSDSRIRVHNLRIASEFGGILDPDDSLLAVVDDKEQIVAIYDEQEATTSTANGENGVDGKTNGHSAYTPAETGSSDSSSKLTDSRIYIQAPTPTSIPARFRASREKRNHVALSQSTSSTASTAEKNSVLVGEQSPTTTTNLLVVRRGSEPVLNAGAYEDEGTPTAKIGGGMVKKRVEFLNAELKTRQHEDDATMMTESTAATGRFARTAARKSRLTDEWLEVAAQAAEDYRAKKFDDDRWEDEKEDVFETINLQLNPPQSKDESRSSWSKAFEFEPAYENQKTQHRVLKALVVTRTPEESEAGSESLGGKLLFGDSVVDINGLAVGDVSFEKAVEYFYRQCDRGQPFMVTVNRSSVVPLTPDQYRPPAPVFPDFENRTESSDTAPKPKDASSKSSTTLATASAPMAALQKGNTRRIGQRFQIELKKQPPPDGFGFTLTSRDNEYSASPTSELGPSESLVYVKTICPSGAAIEDGRLKAGDRLLEVNSLKLTKDFGQPEVVRLLRQLKPGDVVRLVVSRQTAVAVGESDAEKPALPRPLKDENDHEDQLEEEKSGKRSYDQVLLTFDIPLNDTGQPQGMTWPGSIHHQSSAGLGVSVKGRMAPGEGDQRKDGGIFVKTILHGGAVHKDGRLRVNDRVIAVNGVDLSGLSNAAAMQRLRTVMMDLKPTAQVIHLTVLRMVPVQEKKRDGREDSTAHEVGKGSDGGKHRLLVNQTSTNNGAANKNVLSYGNDDYAVIVKNPPRRPVTTVGNFVGQWPNSEDDEPPVMIEWSDTAAAAGHRHVQASRSDSTGSSWTGDRLSRRDIEEEGSSEALFVRDAPTRRSMSEKRHGAAKNDPSSTSTFQRIQHQRQTSAPSLQRRPLGGGSLISSTSKYDMNRQKTKAASESPPPLNAERRSMSLESVHKNQGSQTSTTGTYDDRRKKEKPLLHEEVAQSLQKSKASSPTSSGGVKWLKSKSAANRQRPTNESFRQAVDKSYLSGEGTEVGVDVFGDSTTGYNGRDETATTHQEPHYAQIAHSSTADSIAATNRSRPVNKEKDRRKSTGSGLSLKNLFRFGSGGKANRPFAVVSPVNNGGKMEDEENEYEAYAKLNKKETERCKSQERGLLRTIRDEDSRTHIHEGSERIEADKAKYQSNSQFQKNQDHERQKQLEAQAIARKQHEEEQWRIRQHYERMKGQQLKQQNLAPSAMTTVIVNSTNGSPPGSHSPKNMYAVHSKMPTHWKPPLPASSPPQARIRQQPVMGREMAVQVQHGRQHSGGGSTTSSGSRLNSPGGTGQFLMRPAADYYAQGHSGYYPHQFHPTPASMQLHAYGTGYPDQMQGNNNRQRSTNNNSNSPKMTKSPSPQSSWFTDGVGGAASVRHHRFYYSSMDGRPSERTPTKSNGAHQQGSIPHSKESQSASQLMNAARARCTSEHVDNWSAASQSTSSVPAKRPTALIDDGTSKRHQQRNGQHKEPSSPRLPALARVYLPEASRAPESHHRIIIGSIPTFDSRKNDGVTRIIIDHQNSAHAQPPPPPPDYEQYLRSRHARKTSAPGQPSMHQTRPCSEFIGEDSLISAKYESSSLPRKGGKKSEHDPIMATPPARDVHYFYHPQQQLK